MLLLKKVKRTKLHATNQNQIQGRRAFFKSTDPMQSQFLPFCSAPGTSQQFPAILEIMAKGVVSSWLTLYYKGTVIWFWFWFYQTEQCFFDLLTHRDVKHTPLHHQSRFRNSQHRLKACTSLPCKEAIFVLVRKERFKNICKLYLLNCNSHR